MESKTPETATPALDTPASGLMAPTRHGGPTLVAAKLAAPPSIDAVVRDETLEKIEAGARTRLLLVRAPAGYGKTTVVAHAARQLGWNAVWYRLDVLDHHPAVLVASLVEGIRRKVPDFGEILTERMRDVREVALPPSEMLAIFVAELAEEVGLDLHIILDDYHEAAESAELNDALDYLLANLPSHVHLVLLTRYEPEIPLARLRLDGLVQEVTFEDLRLDGRQSATVLTQKAERAFREDDAERIATLTEGWPAGICLAAHACTIASAGLVQRALSDPRLRNDVFSYLAEEVLANERSDTVAFLLRTCCLEHMDINLANAVAGTDEAARHLDRLVAKGVFTYSNADGTYRYHHLLRDYLRQRYARESSADELRDLTLRTARIVEERGSHAQAIELYLSANEPIEALAAVTRAGEELTENYPLDALRSWVSRLPPALTAEDPCALYLQGQIVMREGRTREAISILMNARSALQNDASTSPLRYHVASTLEAAHYWIGEFGTSAALCQEALDVASTDEQRIHAMASRGAALAHLAMWNEAEAALGQAERLAAHSHPIEHVRVRALQAYGVYRRGEFRRADRDFVAVLEAVAQSGPKSLEASTLGLLGDVRAELGDYEAAREYFGEAHELCDRYGYHHIEQMSRDCLARLAVARGAVEEAVSLLEAYVASDWVRDDTWSHVVALDQMAAIRRRSWALHEALEHSTKALELAQRTHAPCLLLVTTASSAYTSALLGSGTAEDRLKTAVDDARDQGYPFISRRCRVLLDIVQCRNGEREPERDDIGPVLEEMMSTGDIGFLVEELSAHADYCAGLLCGFGDEQLAKQLVSALAGFAPSAAALAETVKRETAIAPVVLEALPGRLTAEGVACVVRAGLASSNLEMRRLAARLIDESSVSAPVASERVAGLTRRETEVLALMAEGIKNREIATRLFLSEKTVKTHINHIFTKLEVTDRVQAVLYFKENLDA